MPLMLDLQNVLNYMEVKVKIYTNNPQNYEINKKKLPSIHTSSYTIVVNQFYCYTLFFDPNL